MLNVMERHWKVLMRGLKRSDVYSKRSALKATCCKIPLIRHSGKCKIIGTETVQQRQRKGLTTKGQNKRILVGDGTVLYPNYGGDYMTVCIVKTQNCTPKGVKFTLSKFKESETHIESTGYYVKNPSGCGWWGMARGRPIRRPVQ